MRRNTRGGPRGAGPQAGQTTPSHLSTLSVGIQCLLVKVGISKNCSMNLIKITHNPLNWFIFSVGTSSPTHFLFLSQCFYHRANENLVDLKKDESVSEGG